jgi:hypothetical protein
LGIIQGMTATTGGSAPGTDDPPAAADQPDRAARIATARRMTRDAAAAWLTDNAVSAIGPAVAAAITRCRPRGGREPTWAEALAGIDPQLLTPLTVVPAGWPLPPAVWRRDLRTRLMDRLKHAAWVTYTARPRSLQVGSRGRTWLTTTTTRPAPGNPQTAVTPLQG